MPLGLSVEQPPSKNLYVANNAKLEVCTQQDQALPLDGAHKSFKTVLRQKVFHYIHPEISRKKILTNKPDVFLLGASTLS